MLLRIVAAAWLCAASTVAFTAERTRIAVFPPVDRTGRSSPVEQIREALARSLAARGFAPLPQAEMEDFFRRHRIRDMGGISEETARAIGEETHVDGVLLSSVDDWETVEPQRLALTSRWVAAAPGAPLAWMDTSAHHAQERPGAFGRGVVNSLEILVPRATEELADSFAAFNIATGAQHRGRVARRFRPGSFAVSPEWAAAAAAGRPPRVVVLPFVVDAAWRDAGEVVASQFVRWLLATGDMEVLEPGVVRAALLEARVIQEDGPSLPQADALRALLDLDLVVSGRVTDYEAMGSAPGSPFLGFSALAIDIPRRQAIWSSFSFGRGDDRVGMFGHARIHSSITLTSELVRGAVATLDDELRTPRSRKGAAAEKAANP